MAFTVKYQRYVPAAAQPADGPVFYSPIQSIDGPFTSIHQEYKDGLLVVYAHRGDELGMTYGPVFGTDAPPERQPPRPTLWVMNDQGQTVAKYDL